jgi:hypothetical protein
MAELLDHDHWMTGRLLVAEAGLAEAPRNLCSGGGQSHSCEEFVIGHGGSPRPPLVSLALDRSEHTFPFDQVRRTAHDGEDLERG